MDLHRGMLSEDDDDGHGNVQKIKTKEKKNILNLERDPHLRELPEQLDWRDYGWY